MSSVILYGITNCDTVRKARKWFKDQHIEIKFHDFRKDGIDKKLLESILQEHDLDTVINKRGTTWRNLSDTEKQINNNKQAIALMLAHPAMIKRPVLQLDNRFVIGFDTDIYKELILN